VFFTAGCNEQVFLLNLKKKLAQIHLCSRFREKLKNRSTPAHSNSAKMTSPSRGLR